jgi:hypothetical protein
MILFKYRCQLMLDVSVILLHIFIFYGLVSINQSFECASWYWFLIQSNCFIIGPFQIIVSLGLLYGQMQLAIIPGVIILLLLIPFNIFIQNIQKKLTVCK